MRWLKRKARVLLPAFTVADWGGLHENVIHAAQALIARDHPVTLVVREGKIAEVGRQIGAEVVVVDWEDWREVANDLARRRRHDLVFAQPFKSREFGLHVAERLGAPLVVMFHGYAHDQAFLWERRAERILVTAESLAHFLVQYCKISEEKVWVVPNGVPEVCFTFDQHSLDEKLRAGRGDVVLASRLAHDKRRQFEILQEIAPALESTRPDVRWGVSIYGDGPDRGFAEDRMAEAVAGTNVQVTFRGWIDSHDVPEIMSRAVLSVGAGRGAMQSLAVGTPCVAAGAREMVGLQHGHDLEAGMLSNFGDYAIGGYQPSPVRSSVAALLDPVRYAEVQKEGRARVYGSLRQTRIDSLLIEALGLES
ncbi:glycosyltransferase family 4 protein [Georgenia muralis]|uniref:Glycosyltransferase involved in cell wall biosynthesis n=1 Tax=Georgenia muralis TaxID=154117 RepID=A0A3N4ZKL9_9MICO|nr:glycosyltransferase family 4 protein [Georgenia muralis]RPF26358.1 glycosyltransferase involved in cell wall biosynthesis [Georgenia muralis]